MSFIFQVGSCFIKCWSRILRLIMDTTLVYNYLVAEDLGHLLIFLVIISTVTYDFNILSFSHVCKIETRNMLIFEVRRCFNTSLLHKLFSPKQIVINWDGLLESMSQRWYSLILEYFFVSIMRCTLGDKLFWTV